jgi:hypothetical protein
VLHIFNFNLFGRLVLVLILRNINIFMVFIFLHCFYILFWCLTGIKQINNLNYRLIKLEK